MAVEEPIVAFMGETEEVGVAELLSVLANRKHSGRLSITAEGEEVQIFLEHGKVVLVSSSNHALRLGRVLVRLGFVTSAQLDVAVREQDSQGAGRPLGQILVDAGFITREQLASAAQEQCIDALTRIIVGKHGTFMFTRDAKPVTKQGLVTLNTDRIVLEASRRADEMTTLRGLLPPPTAPLSVVKEKVEQAANEITPLERNVLRSLLAGTGTLVDLLQRVMTDEASLWRTVISLRDRGLIVARGAGSAPEPPLDQRPSERTVEEIIRLGQEGPARSVTPIPTLTEIRAATPASSQGIAVVTVVVREVIAAFNAGLNLRAFASFSDDHFRRQGPLPADQIDALRDPGHPLRAEEQETFLGVRDVRLLADGRISAILHTHVPSYGESKKVIIFGRGVDGWQIDAVIEAPHPRGTTMTTMLRMPATTTSLLSAQAEGLR